MCVGIEYFFVIWYYKMDYFFDFLVWLEGDFVFEVCEFFVFFYLFLGLNFLNCFFVVNGMRVFFLSFLKYSRGLCWNVEVL